MKKFLVVLLFLLSISILCAQDTINIPFDYPTIQEGINASVNGDVVLVYPGNYYENFNFSGKLITVASLFLTTQDTTYVFQTVIEGDTCESVIFESGEDSTARLIGFTFQNADIRLDTRGVIYCVNSSPLIMNNRIINNTVGNLLLSVNNGGGIACIDASPIIRNNNISNNNIMGFGGGIYCYNSSPTIIDNIIKYDTVDGGWGSSRGGGIYCEFSSPNIVSNYITDNWVWYMDAQGGGIYCANSSPNIEDNIIKDNVARGPSARGGGVVCSESSSPTITNNIISGNMANGYAALSAGICCFNSIVVTITGNSITASETGIYSRDSYSMTIIDNIIAENSGVGGWGIRCYNTIALIKKNTITSNGPSGGSSGGGILYRDGSTLTIDSCIISNNYSSGVGFYGSELYSADLEIHNCIISGNSLYGVYNVSNAIINAEYNWWGDTSGPYHPILNPAGLGDAVSDSVLFEPWLTAPIPVELTSFTATTQPGKVILNWTTATEINNLGFEIERKLDNSSWGNIGFVKGYGTTTEPKEYSYLDEISTVQATSLVYRLKQIDFDVSYEFSDEVLVDNPAPIDYTLQQNYPNPFNPATNIQYSIKERSSVELVLYDILGSQVVVLVNEEQDAGNYKINFNAGRLAGGIYLYRIQTVPIGRQADSFVNTKKMILLK